MVPIGAIILLSTFIFCKSFLSNNNSSLLVPDFVISIAGYILLSPPDNKVKKLFKVAIIRAWQMSEEEEESRRREFMFIANYDRNNKLQYDRNYVPYKKKTMYERRSSSKTNWEKDSNEANNISWTGSGCMVSITFLIIVSSILYQFIF